MFRMHRRKVLAYLSAMGGLSALGSGSAFAAHKTGQQKEEIRFGLTPVLLSNDIDLLAVMKNYLVHATGHPVSLIQRRTYQEVTSLLISGQLDAAWICGYPYVANRTRLKLVAVPVWEGKPLYQAYLITGMEREFASFDGLRGDIHAFSDPNSNSGYLVTRALLAELGEKPDSFFSKTFFTYGHRNVVRAVASGLAGSGSVDGYVWEVMRRREADLVNKTKVVRKSEWLGFPPIACSNAAYGSKKINALSRAFLEMAGNPEGRAVLDLLGLDGFTKSEPSLFDSIARKVDLVASLQ